jgi:hypothetical protein
MMSNTGIRRYLRRPEFIVIYSLITLTLIAAICGAPTGTVEPNVPIEPTEADEPTDPVEPPEPTAIEPDEPAEPVEPPPTEAVEVDELETGLALEVKRDIANAYATLANIGNFDLLDTGDFKDPIIDNWLVTTDSNGQAQLCPSDDINRGTQTCNDTACHIYVFEGSDFGPYACPETGMGDMCSLVGTSTFDECHYTIVTLSADISGLGTWFAVTYLWDTQMTVVVAGEGQIEVTPIVELTFDGDVPPLAQMGPLERARAWAGTNIATRLPGATEMVFTEGRGDAQFLYTAPDAMLEVLPIDNTTLPPRAWQPAEQLPVLTASMRDIEPMLEPWLEHVWENSETAQIDLGPYPEPIASESLQVTTFGEVWQDSRLHEIILYAVDWSLISDELFREPPQVEVTHRDPEGNQTEINPDAREVGYDPERARALMAEAGYPEGMRMGLVVPDEDEMLLKTAEVISEQMSAIGIEIQVVQQSEFPTLSRAVAVNVGVPMFMLSLE